MPRVGSKSAAPERGSVRSLERGLALLAAMNRHKVASVIELAQETQLPRPTIYRLIETLRRAGFVARSGSADRFCVARRVRTLSDGFVEDEWISAIAAPRMVEFTRAFVWPLALFTFEEGRMLVRETTHAASALSIDYGMVGRRLPMLRTAGGRAYLAFCPDNERRAILELLAHSELADDRLAREPQRLSSLFKTIRHKGYAVQDREINPKTAGMAVPIRVEGRVIGCMSLIWIASALTMDEAELRFVTPLAALANDIARGCPSVNGSAAAAARARYPGPATG
jgi:IclR family mhp operon transcriptional activator